MVRFGALGAVGGVGARDDAGVGLFDPGLGPGLAITVQEGAVDGASRLGLALQFAQADGGDVVVGQGAARGLQAGLDRGGALARDLGLGVQVGHDAADLGLDLGVDVGQLAACADHVGMQRAIANRQVGDAGADGGALAAQVLHHGRGQGLGHVVAVRSGRHLGTGGAKARVLLGLDGRGRRPTADYRPRFPVRSGSRPGR